MSTPRSITLPPGVHRVVDPPTGLVTLRATGSGIGTVLLAPGFTGSKEDFLDLFPPLTGSGWTVIAMDHRGQFESPRAGQGGQYGLELWADDLVTLAGQLQPPVHLVGHSLGGLIAGVAASRHDWASVTFLNSGSGPIHQSQRDRLRVFLSAVGNFSLEQIWEAKAQTDRALGWQPPSPEVEDFMRRRFLATDPESLAAMARILLQGLHQDLRGVKSSLLVAFGIDDPDSWSWQTQVDLAQRWRARLALIPDAAHSPAVEAPEATAGLLTGLFLGTGGRESVRPPGNGYAVNMQIMAPLDADPATVAAARRIVGDHLWGWGMQSVVEDAELVTSELVTNALRHGTRPVELRLSALPGRVRISVLDTNTADVPHRVTAAGLEPGGRGLMLIEQLCVDWGHDVGATGKQVWAELGA